MESPYRASVGVCQVVACLGGSLFMIWPPYVDPVGAEATIGTLLAGAGGRAASIAVGPVIAVPVEAIICCEPPAPGVGPTAIRVTFSTVLYAIVCVGTVCVSGTQATVFTGICTVAVCCCQVVTGW